MDSEIDLLVKAVSYFKRVEYALGDETLKTLFAVLKDYRCNRITIPELIKRVMTIFKSNSEFLSEFNNFLPKGISTEALDFLVSVKIRFEDNYGVFKEFLNFMILYTQEEISMVNLVKAIARLFRGHPDLFHEFLRFTPGQDIDLNLSSQVLNNESHSWPSKPCEFGIKISNKHRQDVDLDLDKLEDERFEMDMEIEAVRSAIQHTEEFLKRIHQSQNDLNDYFTARNLKCIRRLYGEQGLEMMNLLHDSPMDALPDLLVRLKKEEEEHSKRRSDFKSMNSSR